MLCAIVGFIGTQLTGGSSIRETIGILLLLAGIFGFPAFVIFFIVSLIRKKRRRFSAIGVAVSIVALFIAIALMARTTPAKIAAYGADQPAKKTTQLQSTTTPVAATTAVVDTTRPQATTTTADKEQNLLVEKMGLSASNAEHVKNTLHSIGLSPLVSCMPEKGITGAYIVTCNNASATVIVENGRVKYCYSGDVTLYDASDGGKKENVQDYVIDPSKKAYYISYAQDYVKQGLKSPSTAEFPGTFWGTDDYSVTRYKDTVTVQSYVDSQNGFGAVVRSKFIVQLSYADCSCKYLEIDGTVLYKE